MITFKLKLTKAQILLSFLILYSSFAFSQIKPAASTTIECETPDPTLKEMERLLQEAKIINAIIAKEKENPKGKEKVKVLKEVPLTFVVPRADDGSSIGSFRPDTENINAKIVSLDQDFIDFGFDFLNCGIYFVDDSYLYTTNNATESVFSEYTTINIFPKNGGGASGTQPMSTTVDNIVRGNDRMLRPESNSLPHEMGHIFGLLHTFGGRSDYINPPIPGQQDHPYTGDYPRELAIRAPIAGKPFPIPNCSTSADFLCDTEAACQPSVTAFPGCSQVDCNYSGTYIDYNNDPITPQMDNYMAYYTDACRSAFTPGQNTRSNWYYDNYRVNHLSTAKCGNLNDFVEFEGTGTPLNGVNLRINFDPTIGLYMEHQTDATGNFTNTFFNTNPTVTASVEIPAASTSGVYSYAEWQDGVNIFDVVLLEKHLQGDPLFSTGYKHIAADVNQSGNLDALDVKEIKKLILYAEESFPDADAPWRFVPEHILSHPDFNTNPFAIASGQFMDDTYAFTMVNGGMENGFDGVKLGDVNGSNSMARLSPLKLKMDIPTAQIDADEEFELSFKVKDFETIIAGQMGLFLSSDDLEVLEVKNDDLDGLSSENFNLTFKDQVRMSWSDENLKSINLKDGQSIFTLKLKAKRPIVNLSEVINLEDEILANQFFQENGALTPVSFDIGFTKTKTIVKSSNLRSYPNPISKELHLVFYMDQSSSGTIKVYDASGKLLKTIEENFRAGLNKKLISDLSDLPTGILIVRVEGKGQLINGRVVKLD